MVTDTLTDLYPQQPDEIRTAIYQCVAIPIGTVPIYQALESVHGNFGNFTEDDFLHIIKGSTHSKA
jgi:phosphomethylpyrimidine synthase